MSRSAAQAVAASRSAVAVSSILEEKRGLKPLDGFLHPDLWEDDELLGRARLQILFGVLGGLVGVAFSGFFFAIGHVYGGAIIGTCGLLTTLVPWVIRHSGNLKATGYLYGFVLLLGFTGLCAVGGGVQGYAIPWLAAVPLAVLLLVDLRGALTWTAVAFTTVLALAVCEMAGYGFPTLYKDTWEPAVAALSAVGLVAFLSFLGLSFEKTRAEAFRRMDISKQQLKLENGDLKGRYDEKSTCLHIAAHGLKLPLTRICDHADRLRHTVEPSAAEIGRRADEILRAAGRSLERVDRLLDLGSLEAGRGALKKEPVDVETVVSEVLKSLSEKAADAGTSMRQADGDDDRLVVKGDGEALFQILENLVANAVEHSPVGGMVEVRTGRDRSWAVIEICDEGSGLAEDHGAKLFRKVSRSDGGRAVSESDSVLDSELGLGLWIVRRLTEAMGGTVFCRSESGAGSSFGVRLPVVGAAELDQMPAPSSSADEPAAESENAVKPVEFPATFKASVNASGAAAFVPGDPLVGRLSSDGGVEGADGDGDATEGGNVILPS